MSTMVAMKTLSCWYPREFYSMSLYALLDMEKYTVVAKCVRKLVGITCLYPYVFRHY